MFAIAAVHTSSHDNNGGCIRPELVLLELFKRVREPDVADYVFAAEQETDIFAGVTYRRKDLCSVRRWTGSRN